MKIVLDSRETNLFNNIKKYIVGNELNHLQIEQKSLNIGDILITSDDDKTILCIERKTIKDLLSSIVDGRYKEQSFRLNSYDLHNHNIIYLIEGSCKYLDERQKKMYFGSLFTIFFSKGFSLIQTSSILETAEYIVRFTDKMYREKELIPFYSLDTSVNTNDKKQIEYVDVIHCEKKKNINENNIHIIMLCQIPGVSTTYAKAIFEKYDSIGKLIESLKEDSNCLNELKYINSKDVSRKISKTCIENIKKYLLN